MVILFLIPLFIIAGIRKLLFPKKLKALRGQHVVITGGSSGIGKSVAILAAGKGANVSIIARNRERLQDAKKEIEIACVCKDQAVTAVSVDVADQKAIRSELNNLEEKVGPVYMLINCAGMAVCGKVEDFSEEDARALFNVNYFGTLYPVQTMVPKFKERKKGIIVITASQVALMGIYGYSIYSSAKFALRGLAESISMELKPYNISVTLALPPDTDTPGFENENKTKPEETRLISEAGGLVQPKVVAEKILKDALEENFFSYVGFESYVLTTLCVGMSPFISFFELMLQSALLGPLRLVGAYYLTTFDKIVQRCHLANEKNK